jgi:hypothetical protein
VKIPFFNPMIESESVRRRYTHFNDHFDAVVKDLCFVRSPARLHKPIVVVSNVEIERAKLKFMIR